MKTCNTCLIDKHHQSFYKGSDGRPQFECKKCMKKRRQKKIDTGNFYNPEETKKIWYYQI